MNVDQFGQAHAASEELVDLLYRNPDLDLSGIQVDDPEKYNQSCDQLHLDLPRLIKYVFDADLDIEEFDQKKQSNWFMPDCYKTLDIARWVLDQCKTETELQRCGQELLLFQERNLFPLLCYLKYLVDTMRDNSIVWGVGRGSSVASYVLYLIGVHRINSIYYDLDIHEFLKG